MAAALAGLAALALEQGCGGGACRFSSDCPDGQRCSRLSHVCEPTGGSISPDGGLAPGDAGVRLRPDGGEWFAPYVRVSAGTFTMGCHAATEPFCATPDAGVDDQLPSHAVTLDAYDIQAYEVARGDYVSCMDAGVCPPGPCSLVGTWTPRHPVSCATRAMATAYCAWVGARLPTEAEWERAARGTDARPYPWGADAPDAAYANWFVPGTYSNSIAPVGSFSRDMSPAGAFDMAGNTQEWVSDWYASDAYASSAAINPRGPDAGTYGVLRGGSFASFDPQELRAAHRQLSDISSGGGSQGFRCVR